MDIKKGDTVVVNYEAVVTSIYGKSLGAYVKDEKNMDTFIYMHNIKEVKPKQFEVGDSVKAIYSSQTTKIIAIAEEYAMIKYDDNSVGAALLSELTRV